MPAGVKRKTTCRLCGGSRLPLALSLQPTPPANAFVSRDAIGIVQDKFPLDVHFCEDCTHVQLLDIVDPKLLFEHYVYVSGTSPFFVRHFHDYADAISKLVGLSAGALVVDIGSNDGTLLRAFKERHNAKVLGIDPAQNLAEAATAAGIETIADFFSPTLADSLAEKRGRAMIITANNVFAHIDDLAGVTDGVRRLLDPNGVFVFEVSYLLDVVEKTLFDTIYHEHLSYHAVRPLIGFFERHGLELIEAIRVPTHGGSLRGIAQVRGGPRARGASVSELLELEHRHGLDKQSTYQALSRRINALGEQLRALLLDLKRQGKTIAGFGAPAKATTLLYEFGIGCDFIDYIVDDNPLKQGTYTPGMHIPVLPAQAVEDRKPDYLVILAWNFANSIVAKNARYMKSGGRFIVPVPKLEVI